MPDLSVQRRAHTAETAGYSPRPGVTDQDIVFRQHAEGARGSLTKWQQVQIVFTVKLRRDLLVIAVASKSPENNL